jgi:hypothetical protein
VWRLGVSLEGFAPEISAPKENMKDNMEKEKEEEEE